MKKITLILMLCCGLIMINFSNINAYSRDDRLNYTESNIYPYAFEQKIKSFPYKGEVKKDVYTVYHDIKVVCSFNYNSNTYKVSSATEPRIVTNDLVLSTDLGGSYAYLDNQSSTCKISSDKTSVYYEWSFTIKANVLGDRYTFKTITGSTTLKV